MALPISFAASAPIASTSNGDPITSPGPDTPHQRLLDQREILDRLAEGDVVTMDEWDGLVEKCYVCNKYMLEAVFRAHSRDCWHMSEEESEVDEWGKQ